MKYITTLILGLLICSCSNAGSSQQTEYQNKYLSDPSVSAEIKTAITNGKVEVGMSPGQVFAAIGLPGPYMVQSDEAVWEQGVPPPVIINAQNENPDNSIIELLFHNQTHFETDEKISICVRFEKGRVVSVNKGGFSDVKKLLEGEQ